MCLLTAWIEVKRKTPSLRNTHHTQFLDKLLNIISPTNLPFIFTPWRAISKSHFSNFIKKDSSFLFFHLVAKS